jgi:hypothetical protein
MRFRCWWGHFGHGCALVGWERFFKLKTWGAPDPHAEAWGYEQPRVSDPSGRKRRSRRGPIGVGEPTVETMGSHPFRRTLGAGVGRGVRGAIPQVGNLGLTGRSRSEAGHGRAQRSFATTGSGGARVCVGGLGRASPCLEEGCDSYLDERSPFSGSVRAWSQG